MEDKLWQNSECCGGAWLHNYQITRVFPDGVEEVCVRCRDIQFFRENISNYEYLSYHLRMALQKDNPRFQYEYAR